MSRALRLLAPAPGDVVVDWFCGLGNFSLPLATRAARVVGVEGSAALVERAAAAAAANGLAEKTSFVVRNLFEIDAGDLAKLGTFDKWLVDPPREGAFAIVKALVDLLDGADDRHGVVARARADRLRQLQPGDARPRRRPARAPRRLPLRCGGRRQHVPAHRARREHRRLRPRLARRSALTQSIAVPLWLFVLLAALALFAALEWLLLPSVRWYFRRKVRRVMDEISTRFKIALPEFKLTRRQALLDRLTSDPRVLGAIEQHVAESGEPRAAVVQRVHGYAREIVPAFNAYVYFRVGYWLAKTFARMVYRVRLGYTDTAGLAAVDPRSTVVFVMNHRSNMDYILVSFLAAEQRRAQLRGRRVGEDLAAAGADPRDGRVFRAPQLGRSAVPHGAAALRPDGDRRRRAAGDVSRGRADQRRALARAQARPARLHAEGVRPEGRARPRLRSGRHQLRPRPRGPLAAAQARPRRGARRPGDDARA